MPKPVMICLLSLFLAASVFALAAPIGRPQRKLGLAGLLGIGGTKTPVEVRQIRAIGPELITVTSAA